MQLRAALLSLAVAACTREAPPAPAPPPASPTPVSTSPSPPIIEVAITVDDLPVHGPGFTGLDRLALTERMLAVFAAHHVDQAYGFVNGERVDRDPTTERILKAWLAAGHPLANHTYSHISLNTSDPTTYIADLERGEDILKRLQPDSRAWKLFRYPYLFQGDTLEKRAAIRDYLNSHEYTIADVTIDADDWAYNPPFARCTDKHDTAALATLHAEFVRDHVAELHYMRAVTRALTGREIRQVLLLHIGVADADALDDLLTAYEREGVRWIDLRTALADPFYAIDTGVAIKAGAAAPYLHLKARKEPIDLPPRPRDGVVEALDTMCR